MEVGVDGACGLVWEGDEVVADFDGWLGWLS